MRPLLVVCLTVVLDLVGFGIVIPLLTFYAESFHATPTQVTLMMACYSLAQFLFAPVWGALSDKVGRRPVMLASIFMTALMLAGFASATSLWMLFLFRTLHGASTANISTAQAIIADLTTPENRAKGMGLLGAGFGLGFTIGPFLGGELSHYSLTAPLWLAAGLSALNLLLAAALLPETRPEGGPATSSRSVSPLALLDALSHPKIGLCIALASLQVFSFALMESTFTLFAERAHGLTPAGVGRLFGLVGIIGIVIQGGLIGQLVKRFGERPMVPLGLGSIAVGLALLPFAPKGAALMAVFALVAIGQALANPSMQGLISKGAGAHEQGKILGANQSLSALSRAAGPAFGGLLFSHVAPQAPFLISAGLLTIAAALSVPVTARAAR